MKNIKTRMTIDDVHNFGKKIFFYLTPLSILISIYLFKIYFLGRPRNSVFIEVEKILICIILPIDFCMILVSIIVWIKVIFRAIMSSEPKIKDDYEPLLFLWLWSFTIGLLVSKGNLILTLSLSGGMLFFFSFWFYIKEK